MSIVKAGSEREEEIMLDIQTGEDAWEIIKRHNLNISQYAVIFAKVMNYIYKK